VVSEREDDINGNKKVVRTRLDQLLTHEINRSKINEELRIEKN
jgi:hypothetical protein